MTLVIEKGGLKRLSPREANALRVGMKKPEVEAVIGKWNRTVLKVNDSPDHDELWYYSPFKKRLGLKDIPGLTLIFFRNDLVELQYLSPMS
jgi:hypothetical protein